MRRDRTAELIEKIGKDNFIDYYRVHTIDDTAKHFNISKTEAGYIQGRIKYRKSKEEKRLSISNTPNGREEFYNTRSIKTTKTKIDKYGSLDNFNSMVMDKRLKTCIEKYGSYEDYITHMTTALSTTIFEKYGVTNISQLEDIKLKKKNTMIKNFDSLENAYRLRNQKIKETYLKKTGYDLNWKVPEVYESRKNTWMNKYGVEYPFQSKDVQEKCQKTLLEHYGVEYACMLPQVRYKKNIESGPNKYLRKLFENNNITYTQEFVIGKYIYDFKVDNYVIEVNPYATHNSSWSIYSSSNPTPIAYHQDKSINAKNSGYICLCIWDWSNLDKLIDILKSQSIKEVDFIEPRKYIYNIKTKTLQDIEDENTVIIYDDGGIILE